MGPVFKGQAVQEGQLDPSRWDRYAVPKCRYQTTVRRVTNEKTEELVSAAQEACDHAQ